MGDATTPTGRLFRSLRAEGSAAQEAVPALSLDEVVGLRSVTLGSGTALEAESEAVAGPGTRPGLPVLPPPAGPAPVVISAQPEVLAPEVAAPVVAVPEVAVPEVLAPPSSELAADDSAAAVEPRKPGAHAQRGTGATGVWLVVFGVTIVMALADAIVVGEIGWLTGIVLVLVSVYGALTVRPPDAVVAVIAPPLAFFAAVLIAGQLTLTGSGDLLLREALMVVTTLGNNAVWVFGATIAALAIVVIRRTISRRRP